MNQTMAMNGDLLTENVASPGLIGSGTDFGYNNKGIMFNETTHRVSILKPDPNVLLQGRNDNSGEFVKSQASIMFGEAKGTLLRK